MQNVDAARRPQDDHPGSVQHHVGNVSATAGNHDQYDIKTTQ